MRKPMIAGNWKMFHTAKEAVSFLNTLNQSLDQMECGADLLICPPFTCLYPMKDHCGKIRLGAQNMHHQLEGAFTGEISAPMLKDAGAEYVILGHSERRHLFQESNDFINLKIKTALKEGLLPILCIGETEEERETGRTEEVLKEQLLQSLAGISKEELCRVVLAYEPVWAIGTGKTATAEDAAATISAVRNTVEKAYDKEAAETIRILYGGSVKPNNIKSLMNKEAIDGVLVGGASLKPEDFLSLITYKGRD